MQNIIYQQRSKFLEKSVCGTQCGTHTLFKESGYKYKNHFNEMKGDVGMSDQQNDRNKTGL